MSSSLRHCSSCQIRQFSASLASSSSFSRNISLVSRLLCSPFDLRYFIVVCHVLEREPLVGVSLAPEALVHIPVSTIDMFGDLSS